MARWLFIVWMLLASVAHAQDRVPHEAERRAQLHDQAIAAGVLYVSSIAAGTWSFVGAIDMIIGAGDAYCARCDHSVESGIVWSGIVSAAATGLFLIIAIAPNVDHHSRLHALDREVGRMRVAPGPGQTGLAIAIDF